MPSIKPSTEIYIDGIPDSLSESKQALYRSRFLMHADNLLRESGLDELQIILSTSPNVSGSYLTGISDKLKKVNKPQSAESDEITIEQRAKQYSSQQPLYDFDFLVVPKEVLDNLMLAISLIKLENKVFDEWGLRRIEPFPRTALNFHGEPGTGKTLAAHSIASYINSPIMIASYAQIESKYHGEGPKNVEALFFAAERDNAVLFIDEADSLLSKRLTNVSQGSEQAINSMRSQLLISLEKFKGIVIFATNLVTNYDKAFETRVRSVLFPLPDEDCRKKIWSIHLGDGAKPPLAEDVDVNSLAKISDVCGRDIKNALIDAALSVAETRDVICMQDLLSAVDRVKEARINHSEDVKPKVPDEETSKKILAAIESQDIPVDNVTK
jgi:SpoVK/Ycf46/Vps4 family AAA+-type ATPase